MPRTKVSKSAKRNREAAIKEEKLREINTCLESRLIKIDRMHTDAISEIDAAINKIIESNSDAILDAPFIHILNFDIKRFSDYKNTSDSSSQSSVSDLQPTKVTAKDDGYLTEDSRNSASSTALTGCLSMSQKGRTPRPLSSSQVRHHRRSRSACADSKKSTTMTKTNFRNFPGSEHASRNKLRTPMSARPKAFSADRSAMINHNENNQKSPPCAFLRWPKPGEFVVSVHGSPLVAQGVPDRLANVNIPTKDGVLSLRPKRLETLDSNVVEKFDEETLKQIITLKENLDMIVSLAGKGAKENKD